MKKMLISQVFNLWQSYQEIKFRFPASQSLPYCNCLIVTACNPRSKPMPLRLNKLRMEKLQRYLDTRNIAYQKLICGSPDFSWNEPSLVVVMPVGACIKLARLYQQNAIYQVLDGELWLVPVLLQGVERVSLGRIAEYFE